MNYSYIDLLSISNQSRKQTEILKRLKYLTKNKINIYKSKKGAFYYYSRNNNKIYLSRNL